MNRRRLLRDYETAKAFGTVRDSELGTRNPEPETRNPELGTRDDRQDTIWKRGTQSLGSPETYIEHTKRFWKRKGISHLNHLEYQATHAYSVRVAGPIRAVSLTYATCKSQRMPLPRQICRR